MLQQNQALLDAHMLLPSPLVFSSSGLPRLHKLLKLKMLTVFLPVNQTYEYALTKMLLFSFILPRIDNNELNRTILYLWKFLSLTVGTPV